MARTVSAVGCSVDACVAAARRLLGLTYREAPERLRSGGEDGCYRVTLATGDVVEVTTKQHARVDAFVVE